jgi:leader peptidase (prepilin peptidase)/N-methyltransferase
VSRDLLSVLLAAAGCGLAGLVVPAIVRAVPEPVREPDDEPKEPYADIAALPGVAWKSALASAVAGGLVALAVGATWQLLVLLPLVPIGVALALVDWRTRLLPTRVIAPTYALVVVAVLVVWAVTGETSDLTRAALGWLVAGAFFFALWFVHPRGLGYGDVRLSGVLGIALGHVGWAELLVGIYAGFLVGGVLGLLLSRLRVVERTGYPFGPFMLVGAVAGLLWGADVASVLGY